MEAALRWHKSSFLVIALLLASSLAATAQDQGALLRTLADQLRSGDLAGARLTARRYVVLDDANPAVWYNLAGLEEHAGDRAAAAAALRRAVAAGFDDFRAAEADADLAGLRRDPQFLALRDDARRRLAGRAREREVLLAAATWSPWRDLTDRDGGDDAPSCRVRLRCTNDELEVEAEVHDPHPADALPPWRGGAGLVICVGAPHDTGGSDTGDFQEVALGLQRKLPAGALLVEHWQELVELVPKLRYDPATKALVYLARIPWTALAPHHPLLDPDLLVNVTYLSLRAAGGRARAALLTDPATGDAAAAWRRGVRLQVSWPPESGPLLRVRPADTIVAPGPIPVTAVMVAPAAGEATWQVSSPFTGGGGVTLRAGKQDVRLDVRGAVPTGPTTLDVALTLPGGQRLDAGCPLVVLAPDWLNDARRRASSLRTVERTSVTVRLDAIAKAIEGHRPRDAAGALGSTIAEVDTLLARAAATGTTLPASGRYLALRAASGDGQAQGYAVHIPPGFVRDGRHRLLLLFLHAPGGEAAQADLALRALAEMAPKLGVDPGRVAVVIPVAAQRAFPGEDAADSLVARTIAWARALMPEVPLALSGVDGYAMPVLQASLTPPPQLAGVLLVTGKAFVPWPGADDIALRAALHGADPRLPYGWIRFPDETGPDDRALDVIRALRDLGVPLPSVQDVPGDLTAAQASGRAVAWAAGLP